MIIFLFISLSYMGVLQKQKKEQDGILTEYQNTLDILYNELKDTFTNDFKRWDLELDKDLSIKFTNPNVLFQSGKSDITPKFQSILSEFFPKYLAVIMKNKYKDKIAEIRIEGHTDDVPVQKTADPYIDNVQLSQDRARNVLAFLRLLPTYKSLQTDKEQRLQFWLTANGLSYGRTLDSNKKFTYISKKPIDREKSRRVEFRIVTTSEILIQKILENK